MYLKLYMWSRHRQVELKQTTLGKQKKLEVWLGGSQYHRNWQKNLAEQDFCATADDLNGIQVWIWKRKGSLKERNHIWQLERCFQKFSSCQDSKVEATPEFYQTSLILAGILDLFLPFCCYSFSHKYKMMNFSVAAVGKWWNLWGHSVGVLGCENTVAFTEAAGHMEFISTWKLMSSLFDLLWNVGDKTYHLLHR